MSKEIYISSTPHETRLAIVEKDELTEIYYERENEYTLAGSIYNGKVTRVLPGMQSSFVDIGLERDAFLYITDFMEEAGDAADFEGAEGGSRGPRREGSGQRSEGGRSEGRGDRGGRPRREERPRDAQADQPREEYRAKAAPAGDEERFVEAPREVREGEEVGEGAPGADGSRRWRGRRGRRRGRGESGEASAAGQGATQTDDGFEPVPEVRASQADEAPLAVGSETPREGRGDSGRDRGGRDRGRGGRDRSGRDRGGRERQGGSSVTGAAPREDRHEEVRDRFAPRTSRHGSDESREASGAAEAEPFILPGESLSKYRPESERTPVAAPLPTAQSLAGSAPSEFKVSGWDGGAVLPGETIRPRSGGGSSESRAPREGRSESRDGGRDAGRGDGRGRRRDRDARRDAGGDGGRQSFSPESRMDPAEAVMPAVTSQHDVELAIVPFTDDAPAFEVRETEEHLEAQHHTHAEEIYEAQTDSVPQEPIHHVAEAVEELHDTVEEFQETTAEYEPGEDASASFRVDPAGQREFRQNAPAEDAAVASEPEFTTVRATGEMISEPAHAETAPQENAAAPIKQEEAIHSDESGEASQAFAPGDGELEEELMDEEDAELPAVHARHHDDVDEEVLEHAADLGSILRDMSIDHITRPEPIEGDDEEDFDIDEEMEEDELAASDDDHFEEGDEISSDEISEGEEDDFAEASSFEEGDGNVSTETANAEGVARPRSGERDASRGRGRRDGRRSGRDRSGSERSGSDRGGSDRGGSDRGGSDRGGSDRSGSDRSSVGDRGSRDRRGGANSRSGGGRGRHSMQTADLPAISDLLKPGQEVLVQIAKEPIAKKGARITSHIALPGRFLVFMPTVNHTGVSRKIESDTERRRLKEILLSEKGEASGGFIVRTAAAGASEEELRSDLRFLLNLWTDIKSRSDSSKSPALIYHDLNLVERILRDQVTDNFSAIWVDTEAEYERVLRFLQRFQPSLIRRVKLYSKETPLFEQFGITEEINKALRAKVWLKSGGSIVINQTEALVAIDINTGKYVGKTARLEDTILKTNLDAIPEIVRQMRLRDLGGIIIIDFIDMDERKNRNKVLATLEEELKKDRAPSKVLPFNDFGLVAITRKRVKQSLERTLSTTCNICAGTGMTKSPVTVCNEIYIELRKMHKLLDKGDIMLRVNPEVVKHLKVNGGKWLQEMEELSGKTILVKSDPSLHPEQFDIH